MRVGESFCPGILHAVPAKDGLLLRIRVPGGIIRADQLRTLAKIAAAFAGGQMEITARANVQLRSIRDEDHAQIVAILTKAGLLPSVEHDRVRNIVTSPLAGLDPAEWIDMRPLVHELDQRLNADLQFVQLHPKFSFGLHDGGPYFSPETDDLALHAIQHGGAIRLQLTIGKTVIGICSDTERAVECLLAAASTCIEIASAAGVPVRGSKVLAIPRALKRITEALTNLIEPSPVAEQISPLTSAVPLGVYPANEPDRVSLIPSVPLGRLSAEQASSLADLASAHDADLRLAPWRGVVIGAVQRSAAAHAIAMLEAIGLPCDDRDGFRGIAACSGSKGCDASLADVRADAVFLANQLAGQPIHPDWTIHFSGCEKRCAMRHDATAELVATPTGYSVRMEGQADPLPLSRASAMAAVLAQVKGHTMTEVAR